MSCPQNSFGQSACNIVEHPDKPQESFCVTCKRRFQNFESSNSDNQVPIFIAVILAVLLVGAVVSNKPHAEPPAPIHAAK